jgi:hypothetical protein
MFTMKMTSYNLPLAALIFSGLTACSTATFTGTTPSKATLPVVTKDPNLSCKISPESVQTGETAVISVDGLDYRGELFQILKAPGGEVATKLLFKDGAYVREDGSVNSIVADKDGTYTVELRKSASAESMSSTCTLTASSTTPPPPPPPPPPPECKPEQKTIGADIAFLIDNSNSNAVTDCPEAKDAGLFNGVAVYECMAETNREAAVKAAFDLLSEIAAKESDNELAKSKLSIASFPSKENYVTGWTDQSKGWIETNSSNKDQLTSVMAFSRKPSGLTPYLAAITGAENAFNKTTADGRAKVAVLVTDGEPTDSDPSAVETKASALRSQGIKVITIYVTGSESRATRIKNHTDMMRGINDNRLKQTGKNWFAAAYASFTEYVTALVGNGTKPGLVTKISSQSDAACKDSDVGMCAREVYEVQKSEALKEAFLHVIKTQAIECED